jgi:lipoprotein-anchoring transpeptidase ErfK/SrfK
MTFRPLLSLVLALAALVTLSAPAFGGAVEITDPRTGERITYRPSFAPREEPAAQRPQYRFYDTSQKRWVTYQASREEMRERHRMKYARATVRFVSSEPAGTIVVDTVSRYLYFLNGDDTAIRYGVGVGREGFTWSGVERVTRKAQWPDWTPPPEMREREPWLPEWMPGGPQNPMGARALYLGNTLYRIHGTHQDHTIGYAVSSGCIRMLNEDVIDLYERARIGARVIVLGPGSDRRGLIAALNPF